MYGGIMGKVLRVDLSNETIEVEEYKEEYLRKYIGGDGFGARIIYDEVPPGIAPLDPDNRLVMSAGPLAGVSVVPSGCNHSIVCKSPMTGFTMHNSHANGFWAPRLKFSGFDSIVIKGRANRWVYLWVHDGKAEIRDAGKLLGKDTYVTDDMIKEDLGQKDLSCACIGPAGENLVVMAAIVNDKAHVGRGGGAVMGSKNLKAVVVSGNKKVHVAGDRDRLAQISREWREKNMELRFSQLNKKFGMCCVIPEIYEFGDLPVKNYSTSVLEGFEKLSGQYIVPLMGVRDETCFGCSYAHGKWLRLKGGAFEGMECSMPEYETLAALGSNLGITDPTVACKGGDMVDRYGLDGNATGSVIAFAMECYEKGLITKQDTGGLELRFGNYEAAFEMIDKIAKREGFGDILADGAVRAAGYIGQGSDKFVVHIKNMTPVMHDFRAFWGMALQYAVASVGPQHEGSTWFAEMWGPMNRFSIEGKAKATMEGQATRNFWNTLGVCDITLFGVPNMFLAEALSVVTGMQFTVEDVREVGLREVNLRRVFNIRNGLVPADDKLSGRLAEPPPDGGAKGSVVPIEPMLYDYYKCMGWDQKTGKPYRSTLEELGLEKEAKDLWG